VVEKGVSVSAAIRQLEELQNSLDDARKKRLDAEALYNQVNIARQGQSTAALESLSVVQRNPVMARFKEAEAEAERRVSEASKRYGPEHPKMVAAQSDLKAVRENVQRQVNTVVETVLKDYEVAKANEASLERARKRRVRTTTAKSSRWPVWSATWHPTASCTICSRSAPRKRIRATCPRRSRA
jgi:uncharacterized protein involved in exopolysaccharide biosynthesis